MKNIKEVIEKINFQPEVKQRTKTNLSYDDAKKLFYIILKGYSKDYQTDQYNKNILENLVRYAIADPECQWDLEKGLYFYGAYRRGKSTLIRALAKFYSEMYLLKEMFDILPTRDILGEISQKKEVGFLKSYTSKNACFDDLGREEPRINIFGTNFSPMEMILDQAANAYNFDGRIFHITSNLNPEEIKEVYNERTGLIVNEIFNTILLTGPIR